MHTTLSIREWSAHTNSHDWWRMHTGTRRCLLCQKGRHGQSHSCICRTLNKYQRRIPFQGEQAWPGILLGVLLSLLATPEKWCCSLPSVSDDLMSDRFINSLWFLSAEFWKKLAVECEAVSAAWAQEKAAACRVEVISRGIQSLHTFLGL